MRYLLLVGLMTACSSSSGEDTDTAAPESSFTVATTGDLSVSFVADSSGMSAASASDGGTGCESVWRGVQITGPDGVSASFYIDGCSAFSEGGPPTSVAARFAVTSASGERFSSSYFDGALNESVDGCVASIAAITRWADSPWDDKHLFLTGTYSCGELFAGHNDGDPIALPQPGTFVFDWTTSAP